MRKLLITISIIFIVLGIIFTILPMEKFGLLAAFVALILSVLAYKKSDINNTNFPKYLSMIAVAILFSATFFAFFTESEKVEIDQKFEQQKIESVKQDQKDLEDLEGL